MWIVEVLGQRAAERRPPALMEDRFIAGNRDNAMAEVDALIPVAGRRDEAPELGGLVDHRYSGSVRLCLRRASSAWQRPQMSRSGVGSKCSSSDPRQAAPHSGFRYTITLSRRCHPVWGGS